MADNELVEGIHRMGWFIDGDPDTPHAAVSLEDDGQRIVLTIPTLDLGRRAGPYSRWGTSGVVMFGDDPDRTRHSYEPPDVCQFFDVAGPVALVGCRAIENIRGSSAGRVRVSADYAALMVSWCGGRVRGCGGGAWAATVGGTQPASSRGASTATTGGRCMVLPVPAEPGPGGSADQDGHQPGHDQGDQGGQPADQERPPGDDAQDRRPPRLRGVLGVVLGHGAARTMDRSRLWWLDL